MKGRHKMTAKQKVISLLYHTLKRLEEKLQHGHEAEHKVELLAEVQARMLELASEYQGTVPEGGIIVPPPPPPPPPPDSDF